MTAAQKQFYNAMGIVIQYASTNLIKEHTDCLQRTLSAFCVKTGITPPKQLAAKLTGDNEQENISLAEIDLTPQAVPPQWDNIEVEAVHLYPPDKSFPNGYCEAVHDSETEINFYSVYLHNVKGGVQCIADCTSESQAQILADLIAAAAKNYKDNGYLNDSKL